jgi:putative ABC transport system substrate-binding protein
MRRRTFLSLAAAPLASSLAARAQAPRKKRIGVLLHTWPEGTKHLMAAFTSRMMELGWIEDRNVEYVLSYAGGDSTAHAPLVAQMLVRQPDLLYVPFGPFALAAQKQTRDVPIVFSIVDDPVALGLVASLATPRGNATGVTTRAREIHGKQLEILKEAVPSIRRIGLTGIATTSEHFATIEEVASAANRLGLQVVRARMDLGNDFGPPIAELARQGAEALIGLTYLVYPVHREFVEHAARARLPAVYDAEEFVLAGGLMSYSVSMAGRYREAANYVDRILRGEKPAALPVQEPTRFALVINLKTAREIGLTIPQSVLLRADRVIE